MSTRDQQQAKYWPTVKADAALGNAEKRTQAAARIITEHREIYHVTGIPRNALVRCRCGQEWTPLHVAEMLDNAGLLCALVVS